jgi:hypothetical protein
MILSLNASFFSINPHLPAQFYARICVKQVNAKIFLAIIISMNIKYNINQGSYNTGTVGR